MKVKFDIMTKVNHLEKISAIIKDVRTCMMTTMSEEGRMNARPMATARYDDLGNIWFYTDDDSEKIDELQNQQPILLTYAKESDNTYLSISGRAYQVDDMAKKKEYFNNFIKAWYPKGPESEKLTLIKFVPDQAEYWDSNDSSIMQMLKMGKALLTGERVDTADDAHATVKL